MKKVFLLRVELKPNKKDLVRMEDGTPFLFPNSAKYAYTPAKVTIEWAVKPTKKKKK